MSSPGKPFEEPIVAKAVEGEVVLLGPGVCAAFVPEVVLTSLEGIRRAAEEALRQRDGVNPA